MMIEVGVGIGAGQYFLHRTSICAVGHFYSIENMHAYRPCIMLSSLVYCLLLANVAKMQSCSASNSYKEQSICESVCSLISISSMSFCAKGSVL